MYAITNAHSTHFSSVTSSVRLSKFHCLLNVVLSHVQHFESFEKVFCPLDLCCVNVSVQLKEHQKSKAEAMILVLSDMELWVPVETHPYNCGLGVGTTESHPGENATASLFFLTSAFVRTNAA